MLVMAYHSQKSLKKVRCNSFLFFLRAVTYHGNWRATSVQKHLIKWEQIPLTNTATFSENKDREPFFVIYNVSMTFRQKNKKRRYFFYLLWNYKTYWLFVFSLLVKYLQLVDSTVSENKIHSFSGLLWQKEKTTEQKIPKSQSAINTCWSIFS